jgi:MFS family permease
VHSVAYGTKRTCRDGLPFVRFWGEADACIVEAAGVLASVAWPTTLGVFLAAILVGGTFMGLTALGLMGARARAVGDPRRALALMTGAFGFGQIIGPIFAGFASDRLGSFTASSIVAALGLLAAALLAAGPTRSGFHHHQVFGIRKVRVNEHRDGRGLGNQLIQQAQPLRLQP